MDNEKFVKFKNNIPRYVDISDDRNLRYVYDKFNQFQREDAQKRAQLYTEASRITSKLKSKYYPSSISILYAYNIDSEVADTLKTATPAEICSVKLIRPIRTVVLSYLFGLGFFCIEKFITKRYVSAAIKLIITALILILSIFVDPLWALGFIAIFIWNNWSIWNAYEDISEQNVKKLSNWCKKLRQDRAPKQ